MRTLLCSVAALSGLLVGQALAQGYEPWRGPRREAPAYAQSYQYPSASERDWRGRRSIPRYDPYATRGAPETRRYGPAVPGHPTPPAGMTWQEYETQRAGSGGG